jgi:hypothetical protein
LIITMWYNAIITLYQWLSQHLVSS